MMDINHTSANPRFSYPYQSAQSAIAYTLPPVGCVTTLSVAVEYADSVQRYNETVNVELEEICKDAFVA
jgi:hypothetical protein